MKLDVKMKPAMILAVGWGLMQRHHVGKRHMQVVNALIKANKTFDLLVIPGGGHGSGGAYGERKRNDFFVHHLLGAEPPDWNTTDKSKTAAAGGN